MRHVLVDLDGTITEPRRGILAAYRHALRGMGAHAAAEQELAWVIGPPLRTSFPRLLPAGADIERAVALYREHYGAGGMYDADVHDGVPEALDALAALPARLHVCTAKPTVAARPILEHFALSARFASIHGPDLDGHLDDKGDLIAHMLATEDLDPRRAVMIGDRANDVRAAQRHTIPTIGVLWGHGSADELATAGAVALAAHPRDLPALVTRLLP